MEARIRFYLDENLFVAVAEQLHQRGIEAVTARDLDALGDSDINHLTRAASVGWVFCTNDSDYIQLATTGVEHTGIIFGQQDKHTIGDWVRGLELIHAVYTAEEMVNRVEYL